MYVHRRAAPALIPSHTAEMIGQTVPVSQSATTPIAVLMPFHADWI